MEREFEDSYRRIIEPNYDLKCDCCLNIAHQLSAILHSFFIVRHMSYPIGRNDELTLEFYQCSVGLINGTMASSTMREHAKCKHGNLPYNKEQYGDRNFWNQLAFDSGKYK